jgi:hypothetical protein
MRSWFGRPLWEMEPPDADAYFGNVLRASPSGTRLGRSQALSMYFLFLELRHKAEIHRMTGRVIERPIDEMIRPRGAKDAALRIPPSGPEVKALFAGHAVQRLRSGPEGGDAQALDRRRGMVQQGDPLVEREPLRQIVDALDPRESGIAEGRPTGVG